jgi:hypothetical protein
MLAAFFADNWFRNSEAFRPSSTMATSKGQTRPRGQSSCSATDLRASASRSQPATARSPTSKGKAGDSKRKTSTGKACAGASATCQLLIQDSMLAFHSRAGYFGACRNRVPAPARGAGARPSVSMVGHDAFGLPRYPVTGLLLLRREAPTALWLPSPGGWDRPWAAHLHPLFSERPVDGLGWDARFGRGLPRSDRKQRIGAHLC